MLIEKVSVKLKVNGVDTTSTIEPRLLLSDYLRHEIGLTGVHVGCEHGVCGACTVLLDGQPVRSCLTFAVQAQSAEITTIEGLALQGEMHTVQRAFQKNHGLQCGFCTPGMVLTIVDLLLREPNPTEQSIREGISGNLCRCTGYDGIVAAALEAAKNLRLERTQNQQSK
jgi:carbon-monoxide dehydrogenase small subunit